MTHLFIHHTVSNNEITDWAGNVRAIWLYHTNKQGWEDIGYHYLVDPNGVIYEGHLGGDDVVGVHATLANRGSMAIALLGTFSTVTPPEPMVNSVVNMFSWKAEQKNIALWEASRLPDMDWGLLHLAGHRDAFGTTECPGTLAHAMIDQIRQRIGERLGNVSPHIYVDDRSAQFSKSTANWYEGPKNCGFNSHSWYTYATSNPSEATNNGTWRPNLPTAGRYRVEAFVPFCKTGGIDSVQAKYTITHAGGATTIIGRQGNFLGFWMPLGEYNFNAGSSGSVTLSDLTATENGNVILFDAMRWIPLETTLQNQQPSADQWLTNRRVDFRWQSSNPAGLKGLRIQVARDTNFSNIILNEVIPPTSTQFSYAFPEDATPLFWRLQATKVGGTTTLSPATTFHIDSTPPTTRITSLVERCNGGGYTLSWQASDALSGIASSNVEYRAPNRTWTTLVRGATTTEVVFVPPQSDLIYQFRIQATDVRGNMEPLKSGHDGDLSQALPCNVAAPTLQTPPNGSAVGRNVTFSWVMADTRPIVEYIVEGSKSADFTSLIFSQSAGLNTTLTRSLNEVGTIYWRVLARTKQNTSLTSTVGNIVGDLVSPNSRITELNRLADGRLLVRWRGEDDFAGIRHYRIETRREGESGWQVIASEVTFTETIYTLPDPNALYYFRSRATDLANNVEPPKESGDITTQQLCPYINYPPQPLFPAQAMWQNNPTVTFRWSVVHPECLREVRLQVATSADMQQLILDQPVPSSAQLYVHTFAQTYPQLWWRLSQTTRLGETFHSTPFDLRFDPERPSSRIVALTPSNGSFTLKAEGNDAQSGIVGYLYEYRLEGSSVWVRFAGGGDTATFSPPNPTKLYWLRSLALDAADNVESKRGDGDVNTGSFLPASVNYLPFVAFEAVP